MQLVKSVSIGDKSVNYNASALVVVRYNALFNKDFFSVFKKFMPLQKMNEDEAAEYVCENGDILQDIFDISYTAVSLSNPSKYESYEDYLNNFQYTELLKAGMQIVKGLHESITPTKSQRVKSKSKKK